MKDVTIVGGGLVGSLWAVFLAQKDYHVKVYERRPDLRNQDISAGKSINLALSDRGWRALDIAGAGDEVRKIAIPMKGRLMHDPEGNTTFQPYGNEDQAIYSVSRGGLNALLLDLAEEYDNVELFFDEKCEDIDPDNNTVYFKNYQTGKTSHVKSDLIFGADGAFSAVRSRMQKTDRFNYLQRYLKHGYKELLLPANEDGSHKLKKNALHIWPRGEFMLIALPNLDGSYTCTLFLPFEGEQSFQSLESDGDVDDFFKEVFPDFHDIMPGLTEDYNSNPTSSLAYIKCFPWTYNGKICLIGDAAHAIVPFYGQGMNAGFEDCTILHELMEQHDENWPVIFEEYQTFRKPDGDAIADLAVQNFIEMRDKVADPAFLLRKKIEKKMSEKYPEKWMPLYSQVTFSNIRYSQALKQGRKQDRIMDKVMSIDDIENKWDSNEVENRILEMLD